MIAVGGLGAVVVLALATFRTTRIFTHDTISETWRALLFGWAYEPPIPGKPPVPKAGPYRTWIYELWSCPYCLGVWCAGVLFMLWRWGGPALRGLIVVLAVAGVQAYLTATDPSLAD